MLESKIENKLKLEVKKHGGIALKFVSPGMAGVPDRIVLMKNGKVVFVELKAPGKKMRPLQIKRKNQLETLGFKVYCIDSFEKVQEFIKKVMV
ncbi:VRR-NUC domain-containing protein [Clostridium botulinum]|uniref:Nuclease n=1 Tax=Clostridium botulinum C/D str. DC5 TaxID=1443128 RepID=A0A0A0IEZ8_CLOBO|nr:VRR-NUC domain-containing protein [Clostridium botulinum]KGM99562.1 nuclease [Clostridium botulinum C/D str. DC5]KOC52491.1 nuclease [Clostridium botulinum]KOC56479.1 nuclease [Clostridium botulinum]MCD3234373.1 VRR-NUC domain-containing protein [Clostridium botulinum D/C]MCD3240198.1 VRR-NUC domain-containing protein [Clostridium botulinum D/C]